MKKLLLLLGVFLSTTLITDILCDFHITNGTKELIHVKLDTIAAGDIDFDVPIGQKRSERSFPKQVREVYVWTDSGKEGFLNPDGKYSDEITVNYYKRKAPVGTNTTTVNANLGTGDYSGTGSSSATNAGYKEDDRLLIDSGNLSLTSLRSGTNSELQGKIKNYYLNC
ncbi:MAG: hypothetical protein WC707_04195 [Candidatus Babeliaceae bacterium]|jgi:hypothetical protein